MKKKYSVILIMIVICLCAVFLFACNGVSDGTAGKPSGTDNPSKPEKPAEPVKYTVTVDDGEKVKTYKEEAGAKISATAAELQDKLFIGWRYEGELVSDAAVFELTVSKDAAVNAVFCDEYTIYLDADGGAVETDKLTVGDGLDYNLPVPTKENSIFLGWYEDTLRYSDGNGKPESVFNAKKNVYLTAAWQVRKKFSVTVHNGAVNREGEGEEITVTESYFEGEKVTLSALSVKNMRCTGWTDGEKVVGEGENFTFTVVGDAEYTAQYISAYKINVINEAGGGVFEYGETVSLKAKTNLVGKNFLYWRDFQTGERLEDYEVTDGDGNRVEFIETGDDGELAFTVTKDLILEAVYEYLSYRVYFHINAAGEDRLLDISAIDENDENYAEYAEFFSRFDLNYNYGNAIILPAYDYTKDPYYKGRDEDLVFGGWNNPPSAMPASDLHVYGALRTATYYVSVNGGSGGGFYESGRSATIFPGSRIGERFVTWRVYNGETVAPELLNEDGSYTFTVRNGVTYEAVYEKIIYELKYIAYGGIYGEEGAVFGSLDDETEDAVYYLKYGDRVQRPSGFHMEHYVFSGWDGYYETMPAENLTIRGYFTLEKHVIRLKNGIVDGTDMSVAEAEYGSMVTVKPVLNLGYGFTAWLDKDGNRIVDRGISADGTYSFTVRGDTELTATSERVRYSLKWYINDVLTYENEYYYGETIERYIEPTAPSSAGFGGWKTADGEEIPVVMPAEDFEIYGYFIYNVVVKGGFVDGETEKEVRFGTEVTLTPDIPEGKVFSHWKVLNAEIDTEVYVHRVTQTLTIEAVFVDD